MLPPLLSCAKLSYTYNLHTKKNSLLCVGGKATLYEGPTPGQSLFRLVILVGRFKVWLYKEKLEFYEGWKLRNNNNYLRNMEIPYPNYLNISVDPSKWKFQWFHAKFAYFGRMFRLSLNYQHCHRHQPPYVLKYVGGGWWCGMQWTKLKAPGSFEEQPNLESKYNVGPPEHTVSWSKPTRSTHHLPTWILFNLYLITWKWSLLVAASFLRFNSPALVCYVAHYITIHHGAGRMDRTINERSPHHPSNCRRNVTHICCAITPRAIHKFPIFKIRFHFIPAW